MNFIESISNYILGNFTLRDIPKIALIAIEENIESNSIFILAGMNENDNLFEIQHYFEICIEEIKITLPTKIEAAKILSKYYLRKIILNPENAYELMVQLDNNVYKQIENLNYDKKYIGEELNLENLYTWYREIQDWKVNSKLLYYNNSNRNEQLKNFEKNLVYEAKKTLIENYN